MSGPVSNSLAQLEDALLEAGLDKALICSALAAQLHAVDQAYSGPRLNKELRQRLWDHCARFSPKWREITLGADHEEAIRTAPRGVVLRSSESGNTLRHRRARGCVRGAGAGACG